MDIPNHVTCTKRLLDVVSVIVIIYNYHTAEPSGVSQSTDWPAGKSCDIEPNSEGLPKMVTSVSEITVPVHLQPGQQIVQRFRYDYIPDR